MEFKLRYGDFSTEIRQKTVCKKLKNMQKAGLPIGSPAWLLQRYDIFRRKANCVKIKLSSPNNRDNQHSPGYTLIPSGTIKYRQEHHKHQSAPANAILLTGFLYPETAQEHPILSPVHFTLYTKNKSSDIPLIH